ncbi:transposase [bacterium CG2_30_37_16]|nr:MAG: transposase [bacterium CG2_30_37_16]
MLKAARKTTRPRKYDLYDIFCGVLYMLKSSCQWRMLPSDFPKWRSVHSYFQIWDEEKDGDPSILQEILKKISWRGPTKQWSDRENKFMHN